MTEFQIAGKVLGTIVSTPRPGVAIGDIGTRSIAGPSGMIPRVDGLPGVEVESIHEEHIVLTIDGTTPLHVGDKFKLLPAHQDMLVNRWDQYVAVRNDVVEDVWDIPGRGCYH
jgi:D-serine deaminase-like pyridoxal phosphate-dependent protein